MNRRELFKRLAGVGVVGGLFGGVPPRIPEVSDLTPLLDEKAVQNRLLSLYYPAWRVVPNTEIGKVISMAKELEPEMPFEERQKLARDVLWFDYRRRVIAGDRQYTSPRWGHVPSTDKHDELWGYYAEAIERV